MMPKKFSTYGVLKRGMDLGLSSIFLVLLSPLFVIVAVAIKLDSPGPVFFRQKRIGKDGKEFKICKFRSMAVDNDVSDNSCADKYTRVGKLIRKTSIDELPQFINVFLGQMSFIGPRPWIPEYWENMDERERGRSKVRPGITGLAAAKGRNGLTIFEKIEYDLEYVENYSFWQDVKIIFLTAKTVLAQEEVDAGKGGIHNDIDDLREKNRRPGIRVILDTDSLVSVVVPADGSKSALEVVDAALGRNYDRLELVVMNDQMTDAAKEMVKRAAVDGVKLVRMERNGDKAVGMEEGRFLCFVDTGDVWRPGKIAKQLALMGEENPALGLSAYSFAGADGAER